MEKNDTLYLGICMAGAVSAGAYTAGVMDYLIEALDTWEDRKKKNEANVPSHKVVIPIIGGASAGGMTGIITASAINNPIEPVRKLGANILEEQPQNKLYHTWVDLVGEDMFSVLLKNDDINGKIYSLFNSNFIQDLAQEAVKVNPQAFLQRPYFDKNLKVFTTLTNLKGFPYSVNFKGINQENQYYLSRHSDYAAFSLNPNGKSAEKGWMPLDFFNDINVSAASSAAMATGAFPLGLRARSIQREVKYINELSWNLDITKRWPLKGKNGADNALCVDGGVINNEPFFRVEEVLEDYLEKSTGQKKERAKKNMDTFASTMIMIDPFPSTTEEFKSTDEIKDIAGSTLNAILSQIRLKPESLEEICDDNNPNKFLIAPSRRMQGERIEGDRAIACGFFGGFGGFLNKEFRIHDYFLGRANCKGFLKEYFTVPVDSKNPIFQEGYKDVNDRKPFLSKDGKRMQIIPVFEPADDQFYMPSFRHHPYWPIRKESEVNIYKKPLKRRAGKIIMNLAEYSFLQKILIGIGSKVILRGMLAGFMLNNIKSEMKHWKLLQ